MKIVNILEKIQDSLFDFRSETAFRNLVFKGGGVRGIAYMGALEVLEEEGVLGSIERVAGTSSGAIAATLVSFRLNCAQTMALFNTLDLTKVPQKAVNGTARNIPILKNTENYTRLFDRYGWYSSAYFHDWLSAIIADKCGGNPRATFKVFHDLGYRDLHIIASNISRHRAEEFSYETTPDVAVADAVRMSMTIPLYFEALRFDGKAFGKGDYFVDGGLFNNYPIHIFDHPRYAFDKRAYRDGINWETLGLFLFPAKLKNGDLVSQPDNLWEFLDLTVRSVYDSHQVSSLIENVADQRRTITIDDCGIKSTRFDLAPDSREFKALYRAGRIAALDFLKK